MFLANKSPSQRGWLFRHKYAWLIQLLSKSYVPRSQQLSRSALLAGAQNCYLFSSGGGKGMKRSADFSESSVYLFIYFILPLFAECKTEDRGHFFRWVGLASQSSNITQGDRLWLKHYQTLTNSSWFKGHDLDPEILCKPPQLSQLLGWLTLVASHTFTTCNVYIIS